ncbi:MAG: BON domain-containing protein [Rhodoglobus sp.]
MRPRTDAQTRDRVVGALHADPTVDALAIDVTARDGMIELHGELSTHSERLSAMTVARAAAAPVPVRSALTVAPVGRHFSLTDGDVAVEVARALVQSAVPPGSVSFEVHQRVVTLFGEAPDEEARARVRHIVQSARGVDFIDNRIIVEAD